MFLRFHIERDHNSTKTHLCEQCNKYFAGEEILKNHIYQSHNKVTCPQCHKSIWNKQTLRKHLALEHGMTEGALFCGVCPKAVFFSQYHYKKHMSEKHNIRIEEKDDD